MSQQGGQATRILVSRKLVRRTGEGVETLTLKVETTPPTEVTVQGFLSDLETTISTIFPKATGIPPRRDSATTTSPRQSVPHPVQADRSYRQQNTSEIESTISTREGETLAQVSFQETTLTVSIFEELKLRYDYAPVQHFLIPRVLDAMRSFGELQSYDFDFTKDGYLIEISIEFPAGLPKVTAVKRVKRLVGAISWTLRALSER